MIFVIDDNSAFCEALTDFLSRSGYAVQSAANGEDALRLLASSEARPELVLLDAVMPVLDGWGLLAELRKDPQRADVPVVMLSGCHDIAARARESGAVAVMRKPVEPQTLLRVIEHFRKQG